MGSVLAPFLIMLREGLEAALIIGIVATYLGRTGRRGWMPVMGVGIGLAVALSLAVGAGLQWLAADFPQKQQELFEAIVGFLAVGMLTYMVFWMSRSARGMSARLRGAVDQAAGAGGAWGLVGMVFLAVAREGLESVFFLLAVFQQSPGWQAPVGALGGIAVAALLGVLLYRGGVRLDLRRFFAWTSLLIVLVAAGLLAGSLRKLHEAGIWNLGQQVVFDWSDALPMDSVAGSVLAGLLGYQATPVASEFAVYIVYLLACVLALAIGARRRNRALPAAAAKSTAETGTTRPGHGTAGAPAAAPSSASQRSSAGVPPPSAAFWRGMLGVSAVLVLAGLYAFQAASGRPRAPAAPGERVVTVTVSDNTCDPSDIAVPAGRTRFVIVNRSERSLEWEILDGVMVVDERENIAPGLTQTLSVRLQPGEYAITCGLLSSPRGRLRVAASAESDSRARAPQMVDFIGALAEYRVFTLLQVGDAQDALSQAESALQDGNMPETLHLLQQAVARYASVAPAAQGGTGRDARRDGASATGLRRLALDGAAGQGPDLTAAALQAAAQDLDCLLYTSPSPRD